MQELDNALDLGKLPSVLLFVGPKGTKELYAKKLACKIIGSEKDHPDLHEYHPMGKKEIHTMESISHFIEEMHKPPFSAPAKVFIIYEAQKMLPSSSNALLKSLEEPFADSYVIMLSSHKKELLPTIISRSKLFYFDQLEDTLEDEAISKAKKIAKELCNEMAYCDKLDRYKEIETLLSEKSFDEIFYFFNFLQNELFVIKNGSPVVLSKSDALFEKAKMGVMRHSKLSSCLEYLYLGWEDLLFLEPPTHPSLERSVAK